MSMEYSWQSRNKPLHLWSVGFLTKMTRQFNGEIIVFSTNGRNGHPHAKKKKKIWSWIPASQSYAMQTYKKIQTGS